MLVFSLDYYDEIHINRPFYYNIVKVDQGQAPSSRRVVSLFSGIVTKPEI
jgi:hypothetical protein